MKGIISRMFKKFSVQVNPKPGSVLSLLVESQGRINYGNPTLLHDYKGILSAVKYNDKVLSGPWAVTGYPLEAVDTDATATAAPRIQHGPVLFRGQFTLPAGQAPLDTFIDPTGWGKGYIWVNGYNLGRYWPTLGPQVTQYVPGVWLKAAPAQNHLQILELESAPEALTVEFIDYPILNRTATGFYIIP